MLKTLSLTSIRSLIESDLAQVDEKIKHTLRSDVSLITQIGEYIIQSGGKRLRPIVVLLSAKALGYCGKHHIDLATAIEFIHVSTLLHDDVVDNSTLRRGKKTANVVWGNESSVLVGDFLYSRAFHILTELGNMAAMRVLTNTTNTLAEGEVMQLINRHNPEISEQSYMRVIQHKTAKLFETAAQFGAIITNAPEEQQQAIANYALNLGLTFQVIDDVLDYSSSAEQMGKNLGDDLAEGKVTLPLIYAMQNSNPTTAELIRNTIKTGGLEQFDAIFAAIQHSGALDYARGIAKYHVSLAHQALEKLPSSPYRELLHELALFALARDH